MRRARDPALLDATSASPVLRSSRFIFEFGAVYTDPALHDEARACGQRFRRIMTPEGPGKHII